MKLRYKGSDGNEHQYDLSDQPVSIGRSPDADLVLVDDRASRFHCGIRPWDSDYIVKDLKSRNGTYVNGERVEVAVLHIGDEVRVGSTTFYFEEKQIRGTTTIIREVDNAMDSGKGYNTLMREIVQESSDEEKSES